MVQQVYEIVPDKTMLLEF